MTSISRERRRFCRRQVRLPVSFAERQAGRLPGWSFGEIRNVTSMGAMISSRGFQDFAVGTIMEILCFPENSWQDDGDRLQVPFRIVGRVVWQDADLGLLGIAYLRED